TASISCRAARSRSAAAAPSWYPRLAVPQASTGPATTNSASTASLSHPSGRSTGRRSGLPSSPTRRSTDLSAPSVPAPPRRPPAAQSAAPPAAAPSAAPPPAVEVALRYLPLWPFDSVADAAEWQKEANPGGHQPWHLSAELTALAFTNGYLQFTTVDRVLSTKVRGDQAWGTVGYQLPKGADRAAAELHLTL